MNRKKMRILMAVFGVLVGGLSVGLFKTALFGTDPFQCFVNGVANVVPIGFGTLYTIINVVMLVLIFLLDKHYIGLATFINIFLLGYVVEFSTYVLNTAFGELNLVMRSVFLILGIVIMCFASSFYFTANLGVSTYDAVSLIMADKKIAKFKFCRIGCDLVCVVIGFFLHAVVGIGTLVTAFFMGPLIDYFCQKVAKPLLERYKD